MSWWSVRARWAPGSRRSWRRPDAGSRSTTSFPAPSSMEWPACGEASSDSSRREVPTRRACWGAWRPRTAGGADLMIEAVVEDAAVKADVFGRADAAPSGRGRARVEHILDPDHLAGRPRPGVPTA